VHAGPALDQPRTSDDARRSHGSLDKLPLP
jgi:hypothetical protein